MNETEALVKRIAEGIQEKKGRDIVVANLTATDNTVCKYFVICEGNTPTQVSAIADSVSDYVRIHAGVHDPGHPDLSYRQWCSAAV